MVRKQRTKAGDWLWWVVIVTEGVRRREEKLVMMITYGAHSRTRTRTRSQNQKISDLIKQASLDDSPSRRAFTSISSIHSIASAHTRERIRPELFVLPCPFYLLDS